MAYSNKEGQPCVQAAVPGKKSILSSAICVAMMSLTTGARADQVELQLPPQSLSSALREFARQTGVQVAVQADLAEGKTSPGVTGKYEAVDALSALLQGTGLTAYPVNQNTYGIRGKRSSFAKTSFTSQQSSYDAVDQATRLSESESSGPTSSFSTDGSSTRLEEVIVTAQKREERLQDVPMSVTAITGDQLKSRGARDIKDILGSIPGLSYTDQERGHSNYSIRGVTNQSAAPTVGIFLDDISLVTLISGANTGAFDPVFFDTARVEVLKGPQGTLYGGSSMGGAIKYVSALPDTSRSSGYVSSGLGTTAHGGISYNAEGVANLPIVSDVLAVRAGVSYRHDGGYIDNLPNANLQNITVSSTPSPTYTPFTQPTLSTLDDSDHNHADTYVGRVSLLWMPDSTWSIKPSAYFQEYKESNPSWFWPNLAGLSTSYRLAQPTTDQDGIYSLDIRKDLGGVDVTSLTAYFVRRLRWERDYSFLIGGFIPPIFAISNSLANYPSDTKTFSEELRVSSNANADLPFRWLTGLYFSTQKDHFNPLVSTFNAGFPGDLAFTSDQDHHTDQYAAFGEMTYRVWGKLDFTAGARLFRIQQHTKVESDGPFNGGFSATNGASSEKGVSPKFNISYEAATDHLLYASATRGFRPGGPDVNIVPPGCAADLARLGFASAPTSYASDKIWSYEAGSKNEFEGHQIVNATLFYSNWQEIQQTVQLPCGFGFTSNAGRATIKGAEIESHFNLTPSFQLGANGSFTDARLVEASLGTAAHEGDQIQATPKWMGSVDGTYSVAMGPDWKLASRAEFQYRSRQRLQYVTTQSISFSNGLTGKIPNPGQFQAGYGSANFSSSLSSDATTVRLFVDNLFDRHPLLDYQGVGQGYTFAQTLRPRTIGLEIQRNF